MKTDFNVQAEYLVYDLASAFSWNVYEEIASKVRDFDISILVNNVGIAHCQLFENEKTSDIFFLNGLNCYV